MLNLMHIPSCLILATTPQGKNYTHFILFLIYLFYYLFYFWLRWVFIAERGLFSSCREWGPLFTAVRGLLIAAASLVEHGL